MKHIMILLAAGLLWAASAPQIFADDSSASVTLSGQLVCGKCTLHITSECQNVLQVQKDGKTVNYFLTQNPVSKDFHSNICQTDREKVTVTGTVSADGDKQVLTATKIEPVK
jgi:hypothetical protein